jgi:polysaccharide biosynthesis protein PslH
MKILYVVPFVPWPLRVRSYNLIPRLARRHEVYLVCLTGVAAGGEDHLRELQGLCRGIRTVRHRKARAFMRCLAALATPVPLRMAYFASSGMRRAVRQVVTDFSPDVIYVERWRALQYVPEDTQVPVVCDPTDSMLLYNQRLMRTGNWLERLIAFEESLKFRKYEAKLAQRVDASVFCSGVDLDCVHQHAPDTKLALVPNGVDCRAFFAKQLREEDPNTIVFTGDFNYSPNRHAVNFFLGKIFPLIREQIPAAEFIAVGRGATGRVQVTRGASAVDFVPDLRPHIAKAAVAVAPITVGVGVSNKIAQAFAVGTAVVSTRLACGDLPVHCGEHLLIADDPTTFAARVVSLLRDPDLRSRLTLNARQFVEEKYDWEIVAARMEQLLLEAAQSRVGTPDPVTSVA